MTEFICIIPVFALYVVLFAYLKFQRVSNPVALIILWWCFWLFLSNFSLTGLYVPSGHTQLRVLGMMLSLFLGGLFAASRREYHSDVLASNERLKGMWKKVLLANFLLFPVVAYYFIKAIRIFFSYGILGYRDAVFGSPDRPSILFGNSHLELSYNLFVSPMIFLSLIVGIVIFYLYNDGMVLFLPLLMMAMEAVMRFGRFSFYYVLVFFAATYLLVLQRSKVRDDVGEYYGKTIKKVRQKIIAIVLVVCSMIGAISVAREGDYINVYDTLKRFAIGYHTAGLVLFDSEITDPKSRLNTDMSYGRSTVGGLETIGVMFLRRVDQRATSIVQESGTYRHEIRVVGYDEDGIPILYNAFYTVLYSLYFDGRDLFVVFIPFLFGYAVSSLYADWLRRGAIGSLMVLVLLFHVGVFSLFYSPVEEPGLWMVLVALLILNAQHAPGDAHVPGTMAISTR